MTSKERTRQLTDAMSLFMQKYHLPATACLDLAALVTMEFEIGLRDGAEAAREVFGLSQEELNRLN